MSTISNPSPTQGLKIAIILASVSPALNEAWTTPGGMLSCARPVEGARRRRLEDAHRRARAGQWLSSLAWRRGGPESRLRQPGAAEIGDRARTMRRRGELVERSFAHVLDRGGMRRAWLRGRENIHKRYLIHVAGFNLGVLMRALHGQGTPREAAEAAYASFSSCEPTPIWPSV